MGIGLLHQQALTIIEVMEWKCQLRTPVVSNDV
jgi:hypothetical protein